MFSHGCSSFFGFESALIVITHLVSHIIMSQMKCVGDSRILSNTNASRSLCVVWETILCILVLDLDHLLRQVITVSLLHFISWVFVISLRLSSSIPRIPVKHLNIAIFRLLWTKRLPTFSCNLRRSIPKHI